MVKKRTSLGDTVTTSYGKTPDRGLPVEHVTLECTQPMLVLVPDNPGKNIYDDRSPQNWVVSRRPIR